MKKCKHFPVFGYDLALLVMCNKCKKELKPTVKNIRRAILNEGLEWAEI